MRISSKMFDEIYEYNTAEDSVVEKDWAAGSSVATVQTETVIRQTMKSPKGSNIGLKAAVVQTTYSPALWKIIDEPVVNVLDHVIRTADLAVGLRCNEVKVHFDQDGTFTIWNNGAGIPVVKHEKASIALKRTVYIPSLVFGELFQGSNKVRDPQSIIGGTNGIGAKLSNFFSTSFTVETDDGTSSFTQTWTRPVDKKSGPATIGEPKIGKTTRKQFTRLTFKPNYKGIFATEWNDDVYQMLSDVFRTRIVFAAAYAGNDIKWSFNDFPIRITSIADVAKLYHPELNWDAFTIAPEYDEAKCTHDANAKSIKYAKLPWSVAVASGANILMSVVNGCVVKEGSHLKHMKNVLSNSISAAIEKTIGDAKISAAIQSQLAVFMIARVPSPSWSGQRKDVLDTNIQRFKSYDVPDKIGRSLAKCMKAYIISQLNPAKVVRHKVEYDKYDPAKFAGIKSTECTLFCAEGDSAKSQLSNGINRVLNMNYIGIITLGGVIMNVRKAATRINTPTGTYWKMTEQLQENKFIQKFFEVCGIDIRCKYDPKSPTFEKEIAKLRYHTIVIATDEDRDGVGNITGLFLCMIQYFVPNLIKLGHIKRLRTPICRWFPKSGGRVLNFYTAHAEEEYMAKHPDDISKYDLKYYKGLASHDEDEMVSIFKNYKDNLTTFTLGPDDERIFEIHYGKSSDLRKEELSKPIPRMSAELIEHQERTKTVSCGDHLTYSTGDYERDNLERKLISVIDGQLQVGRIILDGSLKIYRSEPHKAEIKTAQLGNDIAKRENYHHGEDGLGHSVSGRCFITTGGYQLPLLRPAGQHGSRDDPEHGATRYTFVKSNKRLTDLLFPPLHYQILKFTFDEGKRGPPQYFIPTLPLAIMEFVSMPSHGWKLETHGRDWRHVVANVRRLIQYGRDCGLMTMMPASYKGTPYQWNGTYRFVRGIMYSIGNYTISGNMLTITELPIRTWSQHFIDNLKKMMKEADPIVIDYSHQCTSTTVYIKVELADNAIERLSAKYTSCDFDPIEEFFKLRESMHDHLNFMGTNGNVMSFDNYAEPMRVWFDEARTIFGEGLRREITLKKLDVRRLNNILRYIEEKPDVANKTGKMQVSILAEAKYDTCASGIIRSPGFIPTDDLTKHVFGGSNNDDGEDDKSSTYNYLLDLTDRKKSVESTKKFAEEREELLDEIKIMESEYNDDPLFPGATRWLRYIENIETVIQEGEATNWQFGEKAKFKFD